MVACHVQLHASAFVVLVLSLELFSAMLCLIAYVSCTLYFLCSVGANPFDEEEEDFSNTVGVPVEALYNYTGVEDDELSFKKGDKICSI